MPEILNIIYNKKFLYLYTNTKYKILEVISNMKNISHIIAYTCQKCLYSLSQEEIIKLTPYQINRYNDIAKHGYIKLYPFPKNIWGNNINIHGLINIKELPDEVYNLGCTGIDKIIQICKKCFTNNGNVKIININEFKNITTIFGVQDLFYSKKIPEYLDINEFKNVAEFIDNIGIGIKKNPIFISFIVSWLELSQNEKKATLPSFDYKFYSDICNVICLCYFYHIITKSIIMTPPNNNHPIHIINTLISKKFNINYDRLSLFEISKYIAIKYKWDSDINDFIGNDTYNSILGTSNGVSMNILLAICQDIKDNNYYNAYAGFELMFERVNQKPISGLNNNIDKPWIHNNILMGIKKLYPALPNIWAQLYSSWNMAFCIGKYDILCFAKLCTPILLTNHNSGLFLNIRVCTLYLHLIFIITNKQEKYNLLLCNWNSNIITQLWGLINKFASEQYQNKIETIIKQNNLFDWLLYKGKRTLIKSCQSIISSYIIDKNKEKLYNDIINLCKKYYNIKSTI